MLNVIIFLIILFIFRSYLDRTQKTFFVGLKITASVLGIIQYLAVIIVFISMPPFMGFYFKFAMMYNIFNSGHTIILLLLLVMNLFSTIYYIRLLLVEQIGLGHKIYIAPTYLEGCFLSSYILLNVYFPIYQAPLWYAFYVLWF